jgi:hypothetical protein
MAVASTPAGCQCSRGEGRAQAYLSWDRVALERRRSMAWSRQSLGVFWSRLVHEEWARHAEHERIRQLLDEKNAG